MKIIMAVAGFIGLLNTVLLTSRITADLSDLLGQV